MKYNLLLKKYISDSGLSLREIEELMRNKGFSTTKSHISKLQNGNLPPAGEDVTRAIAEVTGGDPVELLLAGHIEKAPAEIVKMISNLSSNSQHKDVKKIEVTDMNAAVRLKHLLTFEGSEIKESVLREILNFTLYTLNSKYTGVKVIKDKSQKEILRERRAKREKLLEGLKNS